MKKMKGFLCVLALAGNLLTAQNGSAPESSEVSISFVQDRTYAIVASCALKEALLSDESSCEVKISGSAVFVKAITSSPFTLFITQTDGKLWAVNFKPDLAAKEGGKQKTAESPTVITLPHSRATETGGESEDKSSASRLSKKSLYALARSLALLRVPAGASVVEFEDGEECRIADGDVSLRLKYKVSYSNYVAYVVLLENNGTEPVFLNASGFAGKRLLIAGFSIVSVGPKKKALAYFVFSKDEEGNLK